MSASSLTLLGSEAERSYVHIGHDNTGRHAIGLFCEAAFWRHPIRQVGPFP